MEILKYPAVVVMMSSRLISLLFLSRIRALTMEIVNGPSLSEAKVSTRIIFFKRFLMSLLEFDRKKTTSSARFKLSSAAFFWMIEIFKVLIRIDEYRPINPSQAGTSTLG